jgi:hypothetical protein
MTNDQTAALARDEIDMVLTLPPSVTDAVAFRLVHPKPPLRLPCHGSWAG